MRCFYDPGYFFPLPEEHPFPMEKFARAEALVRAEVPGAVISSPPTLAWPEVERVHHPDYLDRIRRGALDEAARVKLGLPPCAALLERCRLETAGTVAAALAALDDGLACNLAGGTHHAFPDRGLGYCVLNDVAVAIRHLRASRPGLRCFVVDTDAHQGNGTQGIFAGDPHVFTYSIHVGRNYPAEKTPGDCDVELPRHAPGAHYLDALDATLPQELGRFAPDLVFWIAGADVHEDDRFGQLRLTHDDIAERDRRVLEWTVGAQRPTAVLYGGGYNRDRAVTARIHADTVARAGEFSRRAGAR